MIGGLPIKQPLRCDKCGGYRNVVWLQEDLRLLCDDCFHELGVGLC